MKQYKIYFSILTVLLVLSLAPLSTEAQEEELEPVYFSDTINYDFNNLIGSDGTDYMKVSTRDVDGNVYVATNVYYMVTDYSNPFYTGPYYDVDPNYLTYNITEDAYDTTYNGLGDIVLTKFSSQGEIIFSTYFGGTDRDEVTSIVTTPDQNVILIGSTQSDNTFPLLNANETTPSEISTSFISMFSPTGEPIYSTYWGGSYLDTIHQALVDSEGNLILSGNSKSDDFPLVNNAIPRLPNSDYKPVAFVSKLAPNLDIVFSTQIGGSEIDNDYTIALNSQDEIIMMGITKSEDFPVSNNAYDRVHNGGLDAFYTKFLPDGQIGISTFLGGRYLDWIESIAVTGDDDVIITGYTQSDDFPTEGGEDNELNNGFGRTSDAIIVKLSSNGELVFSTYFGGEGGERGYKVSIDRDGYFVVTGITKSQDFPIFGVRDDEMNINRGESYDEGDPPSDVFVSKFAPDGRLAWSVVFGSSGVDGVQSAFLYDDRSMVITGDTYNTDDFPKTNNFKGGYQFDAYLAKVQIPLTPLPPVGEYLPYKEFQNIRGGGGFTSSLFEDFDQTSWLVLGTILIVIGISALRYSGIIDRIKNRKTAEKEEIREYLDKLRD